MVVSFERSIEDEGGRGLWGSMVVREGERWKKGVMKGERLW